jgi:hypothetical protein
MADDMLCGSGGEARQCSAEREEADWGKTHGHSASLGGPSIIADGGGFSRAL